MQDFKENIGNFGKNTTNKSGQRLLKTHKKQNIIIFYTLFNVKKFTDQHGRHHIQNMLQKKVQESKIW